MQKQTLFRYSLAVTLAILLPLLSISSQTAFADSLPPDDYRDLNALRAAFNTLAVKIEKSPATVTFAEFVYGADMASALWAVEPNTDEQKRIATLGYEWAQMIEKNFPDKVEAPFFIGQNLLLVAQSRGMLDALFSLRKVRDYAEAAYKQNPRYLYASTTALLGILYYAAPGFPLAFGDVRRAEKLLLEAVKLEPRHTTAMMFLAGLAFKSGKTDDARAWLIKVQTVPEWKNTPTVAEKDMDFWWHIDQYRAVLTLKAMNAGKSNAEILNLLENAPRIKDEANLPRMLANIKK